MNTERGNGLCEKHKIRAAAFDDVHKKLTRSHENFLQKLGFSETRRRFLKKAPKNFTKNRAVLYMAFGDFFRYNGTIMEQATEINGASFVLRSCRKHLL